MLPSAPIKLLICILQFSVLSYAQLCPPPCSPPGPPPYIPPSVGSYVWSTSTCSWVFVACQGQWGCFSPIVIDTTGDGFQLTSVQEGVLFDFYGTGKPVQIAWTAQGSTNGWLALDRNHNGAIDSAKELFGNITPQSPSPHPNGFLALAEFDRPENGGNGDGLIDNKDAIWPDLLVWIDANHDGISQPDELKHLDDVGVGAISLKYKNSSFIDQNGNEFRYKGRLYPVAHDSVNRVIYDVFLKHGPD